MTDKAYMAGVLFGDGYCTDKGFGVTAADKDFVQAFAEAAFRVYGVKPTVGYERTYWRFFKKNLSGKFSLAKSYEPITLDEKSAWLRGFFDSEGNAQLALNVGARGYTHRRVSFYSTEISTILKAESYLNDLSISTRWRATKNSEGHIGSKVVYELALRKKEDFRRFTALVGSSIKRKQDALDAISISFDETDYVRIAQKKGAATKRERTLLVTLPKVLLEIKAIIDAGEKPTQRRCRAITGYNTIQPLFPQKELIKMAVSA